MLLGVCGAIVPTAIVLGISALWMRAETRRARPSMCIDIDNTSASASGAGTRCALPVEVYLCNDADISMDGFINNGGCKDLATYPVYALTTCSTQSYDRWACFYYQEANVAVTTLCPPDSPSAQQKVPQVHECYDDIVGPVQDAVLGTIGLYALLLCVALLFSMILYDRDVDINRAFELDCFMMTQLLAFSAFGLVRYLSDHGRRPVPHMGTVGSAVCCFFFLCACPFRCRITMDRILFTISRVETTRSVQSSRTSCSQPTATRDSQLAASTSQAARQEVVVGAPSDFC